MARVGVLALLAVAATFAGVVAQEEKKSQGNPRLPNNWRPLELSDEQKEKYYSLAKEREAKMTKLKGEITKRRAELKKLQKQYEDLDNGEMYLDILTDSQKTKLRQLQADGAKKAAAKAIEKAKRLAEGKPAPKVKGAKGKGAGD